MLCEKKKLLIHRLIWFAILVLGILIPILIAFIPKNIKIVKDNGYIIDYDETTKISSCEIEITFNFEVKSGYLTVAFYDGSGQFLSEKTQWVYGYDKTVSKIFYINGEAKSYEILEFDFSASDNPSLVIQIFGYIDIIILVFFIYSLLLSYRKYDYSGNEIIIYAGWYHHYLKINGTKHDEHNTIISYTAITLSCKLDDGTNIEATISKTNRIALKINNRLYPQSK